MSLWDGKSKVYHPEGDFSWDALVGALMDFEGRNGFKAGIVVVTVKQRRQWMQTRYYSVNNEGVERIFGVFKIEVDNFPRGCVIIESESDDDERHINLHIDV
jgi:hypothetical protein